MQEIERRKMGQNVQNFKKWQKDQEFKQMMEQREREKKEQQADRQRILAQIEQDKADRAAKFQTNPPSTSGTVNSKQPTSTTNKSNTAKLQFKLPDGTSCMQNFQINSTLQDVRNFIRNNLGFTNFTLSTTFPRREFTDGDSNSTLTELELVPNAVILILPLSNGAITTNPGNFITMILWSFVTPFLNLFGYVKQLIYRNPTRNIETQSPSTSTSSNSAGTATTSTTKRPADSRNDEK